MAKNESEFAVHLTINGELVSVLPGDDFPKGFEVTNELVTKPDNDDEDDKPAPRRGRPAKAADES